MPFTMADVYINREWDDKTDGDAELITPTSPIDEDTYYSIPMAANPILQERIPPTTTSALLPGSTPSRPSLRLRLPSHDMVVANNLRIDPETGDIMEVWHIYDSDETDLRAVESPEPLVTDNSDKDDTDSDTGNTDKTDLTNLTDYTGHTDKPGNTRHTDSIDDTDDADDSDYNPDDSDSDEEDLHREIPYRRPGTDEKDLRSFCLPPINTDLPTLIIPPSPYRQPVEEIFWSPVVSINKPSKPSRKRKRARKPAPKPKAPLQNSRKLWSWSEINWWNQEEIIRLTNAQITPPYFKRKRAQPKPLPAQERRPRAAKKPKNREAIISSPNTPCTPPSLKRKRAQEPLPKREVCPRTAKKAENREGYIARRE